MDTLLTAEKRLTESRDLRPGDIIRQDFLDAVDQPRSRDIRLDRVASVYVPYVQDGRVYLVPAVLIQGWDVSKSRGVRMVCTPTTEWRTIRSQT